MQGIGAGMFGPIFSWEIFGQTRLLKLVGWRVGFAALAFGTVLTIYGLDRISPSLSLGRTFFSVGLTRSFAEILYQCQMLAVLFLTPIFVSSAIASEKEQRTVELLLTTSVGRRDLILGRWLSYVARLSMILIAGIPVLALSAIWGSAALDDLLLASLFCLLQLLSLSAVAMVVSVESPNVRRSLFVIYLFVFVLLLLPSFCLVVVDRFFGIQRINGTLDPALASWLEYLHLVIGKLYWLQPQVVLDQLLQAEWNQHFRSVLFKLILAHLAMTGGLLTVAMARLRLQISRSKRQSPALISRRPVRSIPYWLESSPVLWREWIFHQTSRTPRRLIVLATLLFSLLLIAGFIAFDLESLWSKNVLNPKQMLSGTSYLQTIFAIGSMFSLLLVAVRGASSVGTEREMETWMSLLVTPLPARTIVLGKIVASMKPALYFLFLMFPAVALGILLDAVHPASLVTMPVCLLGYAFFVASLGVHQSLWHSSKLAALALTLVQSVILAMFTSFLTAAWGTPFVLALTLGTVKSSLPANFALESTWPTSCLANSVLDRSPLLSTNWLTLQTLGHASWLMLIAVGCVLVVSSCRHFAIRVGQSDSGKEQGLTTSELKGLVHRHQSKGEKNGQRKRSLASKAS